MKKLPFCLLMVFAAACSKDKTAPASGSDTTAGSSMSGGSGSAMAGSGSAMAGSAMAGSGSDMGSGMAMGSGSAMGSATAGGGSGSAVAMAGSGGGSAAWDFDKLTHEEQMDFMKKTVVPTMKPVFQKFDPKHYADFGCKTCHGKDPKKTHFKMPTPDLPKLDFVALKAGKQKPEIAKWMGEEIEPGMAKLLQRPVYNPEKPDPGQFGCLGCHEQKK